MDLIIFESFLTILDQQAKSAAKVQKRFDIRKSRHDKIHFLTFHIVYLSAKWHFLWIFVKIICAVQNFCLPWRPVSQTFATQTFSKKRWVIVGASYECLGNVLCNTYAVCTMKCLPGHFFVWHMWLLYNQKHGLDGKISDYRHFETFSTFWKRFLSPFCHIDLTKWMFFDDYSGKICICSIFFVSLPPFCCFLEQYCRLTEI